MFAVFIISTVTWQSLMCAKTYASQGMSELLCLITVANELYITLQRIIYELLLIYDIYNSSCHPHMLAEMPKCVFSKLLFNHTSVHLCTCCARGKVSL